MINFHNFKPIFMHKQLVISVRAIIFITLLFCVATIIDLDILH